MIHLKNISLSYGDRRLFDDISTVIKANDKIALVGRNGVGKTTLFRIINREISGDGGQVEYQNDVEIGYLDQYLEANDSKSVWDVARAAFAEVLVAEEKMQDLIRQMESASDYESPEYMQILEDYNRQLELVGGLDSERIEKKIELILKGLGFSREEFMRPLSTFSGGWKMRAQFAQLLLQEPNLLLLDEPTNHLDIEAIIWLEGYIRDYPGAVILISHDRAFMQNTADRVLELEMGKMYDYHVPFKKYEVLKVERRSLQEASFKNQQKVIAERERTIKRFMAKATKTSMAQSMQKQLDKMERIELDKTSDATMQIRFLPIPRSGRTVVKATGLSKAFGTKKVLENISLQVDRGDRLCIVGQNGQGKTTLAKLLIEELEADSGRVEHGTQLHIGYYAQNQSEGLDDSETIIDSMDRQAPDGMRTRVRSVLGAFMFSGEDVEKKIKVLSGGERARLALARMLMEPLNVLILDEPTNHLDMASKQVLKEALLDYDGTLIVVSHDRDFLGGLTSKTLELKDLKMKTYLGDINYFLEKKNFESLRQVELQESAASQAQRVQKKEVTSGSYEDRKLIQKEVKQAEKQVARLEAEVRKLEDLMGQEGFYLRDDTTEITSKYGATKKALEEAEMRWLEMVDQAENEF